MKRILISKLHNGNGRYHVKPDVKTAEMPECWEISAADMLYLPIIGDGNNQRFATLFAAVWEKFASSYRSKMIEWWTEHPDRSNLHSIAPAYVTPYIEFCTWAVEEPAECREAGLHLRFNPAILDKMPDEMVQLIVAHELAHAWQFAVCGAAFNARKNEDPLPECASSWPNVFMKQPKDQGELAEFSAHTISIKEWGFRSECPYKWVSHLNQVECHCSSQPPCPIEYCLVASISTASMADHKEGQL